MALDIISTLETTTAASTFDDVHVTRTGVLSVDGDAITHTNGGGINLIVDGTIFATGQIANMASNSGEDDGSAINKVVISKSGAVSPSACATPRIDPVSMPGAATGSF